MRTTKKQYKKQIIEKIEVMEQNTFLFPKSWSDLVQMANHDWQYKTYNSGQTGASRYHNIEIHQAGVKILDINFRNERIEIIQDLAEKQRTISEVSFYVSAIFAELHTFNSNDESKRQIRKAIAKKLEDIKDAKKQLAELEQKLIDAGKPLKVIK